MDGNALSGTVLAPEISQMRGTFVSFVWNTFCWNRCHSSHNCDQLWRGFFSAPTIAWVVQLPRRLDYWPTWRISFCMILAFQGHFLLNSFCCRTCKQWRLPTLFYKEVFRMVFATKRYIPILFATPTKTLDHLILNYQEPVVHHKQIFWTSVTGLFFVAAVATSAS